MALENSDMQVTQIEQFIVAIENGLKSIPQEDLSGMEEWTNAVKCCLLDIAEKFKLVSNCQINAFPLKYAQNDSHEWLYDAIFYEGTENSIKKIWLTVESEWSTSYEKIYWDFSKLLVARSAVHLMIFGATKKKYKEHLYKMKECINNSELCKDGSNETYLFAAYPRESDGSEPLLISKHKYGESLEETSSERVSR